MSSYPLAPEQASNYASQFDPIFYTLLTLTIFFTGLVLFLLLYFSLRYRRGSRYSRAGATDHNYPLEAAGIGTMLLVGFLMFIWAARPFASVYGKAPANAIDVFVIGKQWMWHMQHTNGIRENNTLHIPVGRPVKLTMTSQDVIHSFFVPAFRIHRDVVPGRYTSVWFTPTKVGRFYLFCSQYCGTQHSQMTGWVTVMPKADYQAWLTSGGVQAKATGQTPVQIGESLFNQYNCISCHGLAPARAPLLVGLYNKPVQLNDGRTVTANDEYLRESILYADAKIVKGYQSIMPPYQGQFTEEQVMDLIAFIKSLHPQPTPPGQPHGTEQLPTGTETPLQGTGAASP